MDTKSKKLWKMFVTPEIVSSEEEEINDDEEKFFLRIAKQNRPAKITNFFNELDKFANRAISKRGKFRSLKRVVGPSKPDDIQFSNEQKEAMAKLDITFS